MRLLIAFALMLLPARLFAGVLPLDAGPVDALAAASAPVSDAAHALALAEPSAATSAPAASSGEVSIPGVVMAQGVPVVVDVVAPDPLPGDDDVLGHGAATLEAVKAAKRMPTLVGICSAIVAGIMLLIAVARRFGGLLLTSNQVRGFVLLASALAGGLAQVADGMPWWQVAFIALSPVVSVGIHQVFVKPLAKKG